MAGEPKAMNSTEWSLLLLLSILWGGAFFFVGVAVAELPPLTVVLARVGIRGGDSLWPVAHHGPLPAARPIRVDPVLVMGLLNNVVPFSF